jgi:molecular chaperone GrpE
MVTLAELEQAQAELSQAQADLEGVRGQLEASQKETSSMKNRALRAQADLDNFRRRTQKEKADLQKFAVEGVVKDLLEVVDNLERALAHHNKVNAEEGEAQGGLVDGVGMVLKQFQQKLKKYGVVGFDSQGQPFDPMRHEALQQVETREHPTGTVVTEFQRGYFLHDRLLRPAMVVVARNPADDEEPEAAGEPEVLEAEAVEAATVDAEVVDAEVVDAEVVDAEVVDAEVVDAEVTGEEKSEG